MIEGNFSIAPSYYPTLIANEVGSLTVHFPLSPQQGQKIFDFSMVNGKLIPAPRVRDYSSDYICLSIFPDDANRNAHSYIQAEVAHEGKLLAVNIQKHPDHTLHIQIINTALDRYMDINTSASSPYARGEMKQRTMGIIPGGLFGTEITTKDIEDLSIPEVLKIVQQLRFYSSQIHRALNNDIGYNRNKAA